MEPHDQYLLHSARNLSVSLDRKKDPVAAAIVNDLIERLESLLKTDCKHCQDTGYLADGNHCQWCAGNDCLSCVADKCTTGNRCVTLNRDSSEPADEETVTIEKPVFRQLFETSGLFLFLIDNIGRLSLHSEPGMDPPKFTFRLNPPGRRQQFLREQVIQALMDVRELLKAPQFG